MKAFRIFGVFLLISVVLETTSVLGMSCQKRNISITVDDILRFYLDGVEITNLPNANAWNLPDVIDLPCATRLIAVHGINGYTSGMAGILASTEDGYVVTNSSWKCSNVSETGWEGIDFDDSTWESAIEYGDNGDSDWPFINGITSNATWIWLRQWTWATEDMDVDVYCRKKLEPSYCTSSPCAFGATCIDEPTGGYCICAPGYSGQNCASVIDYCDSSPCATGTCLPLVNGFYCQCPPGFTGVQCQYVTNNCISTPCLNGGTCLNGINYFVCVCPPEWTGARCDTLHNPCSSHQCANGGSCLNNCGEPLCICQPGWTGEQCVLNIDHCASSPCRHGGTCQEGQDNFTCICSPSLTGLFCEQIIDLCANSSCLHGGTCVFDCDVSRCFCPDGWTGDNCETATNACDPNPCLNDGSCINSGGDSFTCTCPIYWTGVRCESTNYDESLVCGTTLSWSQYNASNGFTRLCYFLPTPEDTDGRFTECRYTIKGIPLFDDYAGLLNAGGNFGCLISQNYPDDLPATSNISCADNYQQSISLGNSSSFARLMICLRYPYEGEPGKK